MMMLSFEEITAVARAAVATGITKVRLTGGEPLVRRGIVTLVSMVAAIEGIRDLAMTTNGQQLERYAHDLVGAGLQRVNVSLDALVPERYAEITRGGDVHNVLSGIESARAAGLWPIKLNCVVTDTEDEPDARDVAAYGKAAGLEVRFIRRMNLLAGTFSRVIGGEGGDCARCNRLRLSCDGKIRPCLFSDLGFRVRELGAEMAIEAAVKSKPERGNRCVTAFNIIGG